MRPKTPVLLSIWLIAILAVVACGSGESNANDSSGEVGASESPLVIVFPDQTFTPESFVAAGWKKSKEYDTATVPESSEIWYGFYSQKDIEIRFYETHDAAIEFGVSAAEASIEGAVKRSKGGRLLDVSGGSFTGYAEFLVAGNAILLCEFDRTRCDELVAALE